MAEIPSYETVIPVVMCPACNEKVKVDIFLECRGIVASGFTMQVKVKVNVKCHECGGEIPYHPWVEVVS